jgi:hypothetical protein
MPLYQFESEEHGVSVDLPFAVDARPQTIVLRRRTIPVRVGTITGAKPPTMGEQLAAGYKRLEDKGQLQSGPSHLPLSTVKRALSQPD